MLRFAMVGSVDDGKSTLIGRLLYDADALKEDEVAAAGIEAPGGGIDFSRFTDGLRAEREQGITIDVGWRHFSTARRRFLVADAPGHEQYTRNMVSAASDADLALLLVDARKGLTVQSRRHALILSLLRTPHVVVAVNKMDLVDWSEAAFNAIREDYQRIAQGLDAPDVTFVPVCATEGDNVVVPSARLPWYGGSTLLHHLEQAWGGTDRQQLDLRFPVQLVLRPGPSFRGYAGTVESGTMRVGDEIAVLPSGRASRIARITTFGGDLDEARAGQAVVVCLADELDVSRGDMIAPRRNPPALTREVDAMLVWLGEQALVLGRTYLVRHTTNVVPGQVAEVSYEIDPATLRREPASGLATRAIGRATVRLFRPIAGDDFAHDRRTGSFILIDPETNETAAAGFLMHARRERESGGAAARSPASTEITPVAGKVDVEARGRLLGQKAATIWLTGLSGAGKSTIAYALEKRLIESGRAAFVLDGDNVRRGLNRDLGFAPEERSENIRRIANVAALMNDAGLIVLCALIAPFREDRAMARTIVGADRFVEVWVDAPLATCEARDPKGLYAKARAGQIPDFTGIGSPYEEPSAPELRLRTDGATVTDAVEALMRCLAARGHLAP